MCQRAEDRPVGPLKTRLSLPLRSARRPSLPTRSRRTATCAFAKWALSARVFPRDRNVSGELGRAIGDLAVAERWRIEELHTEEGRMDDVFRSITTADTKTN